MRLTVDRLTNVKNTLLKMFYDKRFISVYPNISDLHSKRMEFWDFVAMGEQYKDKIDKIRKITDKDERRKLKALLPCATISGVFYPGRHDNEIHEYSKLICIDIDGQDNPGVKDWESVKRELPYHNESLIYAGLSVGGNGLWLVYSIAYPQYYKRQYDHIVNALKEEKGLIADKQCGNLSRLRILSYDPQAYRLDLKKHFRPYFFATEVEREPQQPVQPMGTMAVQPTFTPTPEQKPHGDGKMSEAEAIQVCLQKIRTSGVDITPTYDDWIKAGMALASLGEGGRQAFHIVSANYPKYNHDETDKKFTSLLKGNPSARVGLGTFFLICKNHGITYK